MPTNEDIQKATDELRKKIKKLLDETIGTGVGLDKGHHIHLLRSLADELERTPA